MSNGNKYRHDVVRGFREMGARNVNIEYGSRHPHLVGEVNGQQIIYTLSASPRGSNATDRALRDLKKLVRGLVSL